MRIGPLQLAIHVVQNRLAGEQKSHWDKTNKTQRQCEMVINFLCLSCPSATFTLQHAGFVPREWLAAKGLFGPIHGSKIMRLLNRAASKRKKYAKNKQHHVIQVLLSY